MWVKALHLALVACDHDVTRTPTDWMPLDASDEAQLLGATAQEGCIFTFNISSKHQGSQLVEKLFHQPICECLSSASRSPVAVIVGLGRGSATFSKSACDSE